MKKRMFNFLFKMSCAALLLVQTSCNFTEGFRNDSKPQETYKVITIDSCEYIYVSRRPWGAEFSLTHKGNCKFCEKRKNNK